MRLTKNQIKGLAAEIVGEVTRLGLVRLNLPEVEVEALLERALTEDLRAEDRLNDEVRDILKAHQSEIDQGRVDYNTMFNMIKKKLVQERGLVL